ncbi:MAG TPA: hypothetical protein VG326_17830 [Tepidisphaeraceae bacterium]|jgi:hypothetical protein|nr:hypothetical protein [Tepidisphaeraceae bacterium]
MDPNTGKPIAILTLGCRGEVEQPMMLNLSDAQKLSVRLLEVLAEFGNSLAEEIILRHFLSPGHGGPSENFVNRMDTFGTFDDENQHRGRLNASPPTPDQSVASTNTQLAFRVKFSDSSIKPMTLLIVAGYRRGKQVMLMCRCHDFGTPAELTVCLGRRNTVKLTGHCADEVIAPSKWKSVVLKKPGARFSVLGRIWIKMDRNELKSAIGSESWTARHAGVRQRGRAPRNR